MYFNLYISELAGLIKFTRPFLSMVNKAKAAKLVRAMVDMFLDMEAGTGKEVGTTTKKRFNPQRSLDKHFTSPNQNVLLVYSLLLLFF